MEHASFPVPAWGRLRTGDSVAIPGKPIHKKENFIALEKPRPVRMVNFCDELWASPEAVRKDVFDTLKGGRLFCKVLLSISLQT